MDIHATGFPSQRASDMESVSMLSYHHEKSVYAMDMEYAILYSISKKIMLLV